MFAMLYLIRIVPLITERQRFMLRGNERAVLEIMVSGIEDGCGRDRAYGGHVFSGVPLVKPRSTMGESLGLVIG